MLQIRASTFGRKNFISERQNLMLFKAEKMYHKTYLLFANDGAGELTTGQRHQERRR